MSLLIESIITNSQEATGTVTNLKSDYPDYSDYADHADGNGWGDAWSDGPSHSDSWSDNGE